MKFAASTLISISLSICLSACGKPIPSTCENLVTGRGPNRLVAFGDSQTAGSATPSSAECGYSWANILSVRHNMTLLNRAIPGTQFSGTNYAGMSTVDAITSFQFETTDHVAMLVAFNDMRAYDTDTTHMAAFKADLSRALLYASPRVHSVVVGTTLQPLDYSVSHGSPAALQAYRQAALDTVSELGLTNVVVVDKVDDSFDTDVTYFVSDRVHMSLKGQQAVANILDTGITL